MPVLEPDHEELLAKATWSKERAERFDPHDDPVGYAREYLAGYQFRLEEADRSRHYPDATPETYRRMLAWAGDPKRDLRLEAFPILLDQIRSHARPPYSPEVLMIEYDYLERMPTHARLRDGYFERMLAWLDRVKTYLSIGRKTGDAATDPKAAEERQWQQTLEGNPALLERVQRIRSGLETVFLRIVGYLWLLTSDWPEQQGAKGILRRAKAYLCAAHQMHAHKANGMTPRQVAEILRRDCKARGLLPRSGLNDASAAGGLESKPRLVVDPKRRTATVGGQVYAMSERGCAVLKALLDAEGGWVSGTDLKQFHDSDERIDRIVRRMPGAIRQLIESKRGTGYRLKLT